MFLFEKYKAMPIVKLDVKSISVSTSTKGRSNNSFPLGPPNVLFFKTAKVAKRTPNMIKIGH